MNEAPTTLPSKRRKTELAKPIDTARDSVAALFDATAVGEAMLAHGITVDKIIGKLAGLLEDADGKVANAAIANIRAFAKDAAKYSGVIGTATVTSGPDGRKVTTMSVGGILEAGSAPPPSRTFNAQVDDLSDLRSHARLLDAEAAGAASAPASLEARAEPGLAASGPLRSLVDASIEPPVSFHPSVPEARAEAGAGADGRPGGGGGPDVPA